MREDIGRKNDEFSSEMSKYKALEGAWNQAKAALRSRLERE
ncbi:hypothetical protein AA0121_g13315 [Alternaria tenuissima]|nr:hypothetical protein AA0121_g13315 [Alternaria tenuissima]